jgi:hypothetical protein
LTEKKQKDRRAYPYGFYVIDNRIFLFGLTPAELAVYNCVARHGNAHFLAHLRMATIAAECGCSVNTARKAAHALREKRLVSMAGCVRSRRKKRRDSAAPASGAST